MIKAFKVYKEGTTSEWITILIPFDIYTEDLLKQKIYKYISLGYEIKIF